MGTPLVNGRQHTQGLDRSERHPAGIVVRRTLQPVGPCGPDQDLPHGGRHAVPGHVRPVQTLFNANSVTREAPGLGVPRPVRGPIYLQPQVTMAGPAGQVRLPVRLLVRTKTGAGPHWSGAAAAQLQGDGLPGHPLFLWRPYTTPPSHRQNLLSAWRCGRQRTTTPNSRRGSRQSDLPRRGGHPCPDRGDNWPMTSVLPWRFPVEALATSPTHVATIRPTERKPPDEHRYRRTRPDRQRHQGPRDRSAPRHGLVGVRRHSSAATPAWPTRSGYRSPSHAPNAGTGQGHKGTGQRQGQTLRPAPKICSRISASDVLTTVRSASNRDNPDSDPPTAR